MKTTNYIGVRLETYNKRKLKAKWYAQLIIGGKKYKKFADSEREAAKFYDLLCIQNGLPPKNILKPVKQKI